MASSPPEASAVTYEELADLEREFEDVENEIIRHQVNLTRALYAKRATTIAQIPNFWPLVFEQAPSDIDEYIQPQDSALLLNSLVALSVSHFEIEDGSTGDPRSVAFRWEFAENEHFEDRVLEKRFWYRHSLTDSWSGLVSEPVDIRWKKGKDLTSGLLGMAKRAWDEEQEAVKKTGGKKVKGLTPEGRVLKKKIDATGLGGVSFFAWFGYRGPRVSAEESRLAVQKEKERRRLRAEGKEVPSDDDAEEEEEEEEEENEEDLEIFPTGDELAVTIAEDLWPGAIKYFTQAQEQEPMSDDDFESDDEGSANEADDGTRPIKKRKA